MEMGYTNEQAIEVNRVVPNGFALVLVVVFLICCPVSPFDTLYKRPCNERLLLKVQ
jgi:hypothetical protein